MEFLDRSSKFGTKDILTKYIAMDQNHRLITYFGFSGKTFMILKIYLFHWWFNSTRKMRTILSLTKAGKFWFIFLTVCSSSIDFFLSKIIYKIISSYRQSSTYAVFWDSDKPCKQKTVLLEKWFSTKIPKWDSQHFQSPLF